MSGMLITSAAAQQAVTAQHDAEAEKLLAAPATTRREFARSDVLAVLADVYDNAPAAQPRMIDMAARLIAGTAKDVFAAHDSLTNGGADNTKNWNTFTYVKQIPLSNSTEAIASAKCEQS